jgi:hypothetical protein
MHLEDIEPEELSLEVISSNDESDKKQPISDSTLSESSGSSKSDRFFDSCSKHRTTQLAQTGATGVSLALQQVDPSAGLPVVIGQAAMAIPTGCYFLYKAFTTPGERAKFTFQGSVHLAQGAIYILAIYYMIDILDGDENCDKGSDHYSDDCKPLAITQLFYVVPQCILSAIAHFNQASDSNHTNSSGPQTEKKSIFNRVTTFFCKAKENDSEIDLEKSSGNNPGGDVEPQVTDEENEEKSRSRCAIM